MNTFRINSNPTSALAYRNLSKSQVNLQTTLERLSSGLRINKASDDSAGSAISTRMSNEIQGMKQANENALQANNLIQTAENGLNDIRGGASPATGVSANDGAWHHLAVTWQSSNGDLKVFIDGVIDYSGTLSAGKWR